MKKQPEVTEATRRRIIDSFWILFQDIEIDKITIEMLSSEAHIHRSSFYRYFQDIYSVFHAFEKDLLSSITTAIDEVRLDMKDKDIREYLKRTSSILIAHSDKLYRLLNSSVGENFRKQLLVKLRENMIILFSLDETSEDIDYYVTFIGTIMLMNLNYWYEHKEKYSYEEISRKALMIVEDGLLRLQGND